MDLRDFDIDLKDIESHLRHLDKNLQKFDIQLRDHDFKRIKSFRDDRGFSVKRSKIEQ